ncbi:MAG: arylamine N-acetyltransferase family protein [Gaiellales bacterium]
MLETLRRVHRAHMLSAPFENLDIHLGGWNVLDRRASYRKVVRRRRGGWCFELNGAFSLLLQELGFEVTLLAASVHGDAGPSPLRNHLTLRVDLDRPWLADVGFGESFTRPIALDQAGDQRRDGRVYRLVRNGDEITMTEDGRPQYTFTPRPVRMRTFARANRVLQTDPASHFVRNRICSLATDRGRISLSGLRLIDPVDGRRSERELRDDAEWREVLRDRFGVVLPA